MPYQRHDRRTPASNDPGKQDVSYPYGLVDFPTIVESSTARQSYQLPGELTNHPNTTEFPTALLVSYKTSPGGNRDANWWLTYETLPGPVITEQSVLGSTGIDILISRQSVASNVLFQCGELLPTAINVSSITTGATPTITMASDHDLPVGAWVRFVGTNSNPPLGSQTSGSLIVGQHYTITTFVAGDDFTNVGAISNATGIAFTATGTTPKVYSHGSALSQSLKITATPSSASMVVTAPTAVSVAGSASGTMQSVNWISRELQDTGNANVKKKVESIVAVPDISIYNENVKFSGQYPFPNYLNEIIQYSDVSTAIGVTSGSSASTSASWGGAVGLPMQAGYRGPCDGSWRRKYYFVGPPPNVFTGQFKSTVINPSIGTFVIKGGSFSRSGNVSGAVSRSSGTNYRTGVISPVLTGPSPHVTNPAPTINISSVVITGGPTALNPQINLASVHGMTGNAFVLIEGTGTILDGVQQIISVPTTSSFQITLPVPLTAAFGAVGKVQILTTTSYYGAGVATISLDLPESVPPKIIGQLTVNLVGTGALPVVTLSEDHYLKAGQIIELDKTICTPSLDGFWQITTVPASNQITVTPPASITGAQASPAGTLQNYIVVIKEPQKLGSAVVWQWYIELIRVPYTSGDTPP